MKPAFYPLLLALLSSAPVLAQGPTRPDSATVLPARAVRPFQFVRYQWDVSVDASFVLPAFYSVLNVSTFGPPTGPGYTSGYANVSGPGYYGYTTGTSSFSASQARSAHFLLRRNETVYNDANVAQRRGAYRFTATLGGGREAISNDSLYYPNTTGILSTTGVTAFNGSVGLGYEWQHQLGRFQLYYGYDVYASYSRYTQTVKVVSPTASSPSTDITDNYLGLGAAALAGVKFYVHPRFSLGLEAAYSARYYRRQYDALLPDNFSKQRFDATGFGTSLTPISAFNATFHFGQVVR